MTAPVNARPGRAAVMGVTLRCNRAVSTQPSAFSPETRGTECGVLLAECFAIISSLAEERF